VKIGNIPISGDALTVCAPPAIGKRSQCSCNFVDGAGNVIETVDANLHPSYSYFDNAGQVTETVDQSGHATYSYYDGAGNIFPNTGQLADVTGKTYTSY